MKKEISIFGAGLVGSLLAIYLSKKGHHITMYEKRADMRKEKISAGKSINLALSDRGWKALDGVGAGDEVRKIAIPMKGRMVHDLKGNLSFQPYGKKNQSIYSVSRAGLNMTLMDLAEKENVTIKFFKRCEKINMDECTAELIDESNRNVTEVKSDIIFGADGSGSAVRLTMQKLDRFNYSQEFIEHGYKELFIPPQEDGKWVLEKNALHIWPRKDFMLIALPNFDGSFTCTLFLPFNGKMSFDAIKNEKDLFKFFKEIFPDAIPLMPTLVHDFFSNPTCSLGIVKCFPWSYHDKVALIGDAAHAIVPFFGQGMNAGFEDCTILNEMMNKHSDWAIIFKEYQNSRKPNTDAIADLALRNFIEMRDLVADPTFILRKKIESKINELYPDKWIPLYSMVTFSHLPYSDALKLGQKQDAIMERIMSVKNIEDNWDTKELKEKIRQFID